MHTTPSAHLVQRPVRCRHRVLAGARPLQRHLPVLLRRPLQQHKVGGGALLSGRVVDLAIGCGEWWGGVQGVCGGGGGRVMW